MEKLVSNKADVELWKSYPLHVFGLALYVRLKSIWLVKTDSFQHLNNVLLSFLLSVDVVKRTQQ